MRVSVLIPVYNCEKYIGAAIESVLAQTFQDFEIIVVDDGSEDKTATIVKHYNRVCYIYQTHRGVAAARNKAVAEANGELITFLDADDIMHPEKISKQVAYLDSHPDCSIVFCRYQSFSEIDKEEMTIRQQQINKVFYPCLVVGLMHISLFEKWGGFLGDDINYGEDTHWMAKLLAGGVDFNHYVEEILYLRRIHEGNISLKCTQVRGKECMMLLADAVRSASKRRRDFRKRMLKSRNFREE